MERVAKRIIAVLLCMAIISWSIDCLQISSPLQKWIRAGGVVYAEEAQPGVQAQAESLGLTASHIGAAEVSLVWDAFQDSAGVMEYDVYIDGAMSASTADTAYTAGGLIPGTEYSFEVRVRNEEGRVLAESSTLKVTTEVSSYIESSYDTEPPTAPESLSAFFTGQTTVELVWAEAYDNTAVAGYRIYRDGTEAGVSEISEYTDTGLSPGTQYTYAVQAYDVEGNTSGQSEPLTVTTEIAEAPGAMGHVVQTDGGIAYTLALKDDGTVWAWGDNGSGQLGDGTYARKYMPVQASGLSGAVQVAAGYEHAAALKADGTVWTWGSNGAGQLGDGTRTGRNTAAQVADLEEVVSVSAGYSYTVALKRDGTVWAWGSNTYGQLGDGTNTRKTVPTQVWGLEGIVGVHAGYLHTLALKQDGTVWAWGMNTFGQLGDGSALSANIPVQVEGIEGASGISAGYGFSAALKQDGTVWTWGDVDVVYGSSGSTAAQVYGLSGITDIACGGYHMLALKDDGTVWVWGTDGYGMGETGDTAVQLPELSEISSVSAGERHSVVIGSDSRLWSWGSNMAGQLGDLTKVSKSSPVNAPALPFAEKDTEIPSQPSDAVLVSKGGSWVELAWSPSSDNMEVVGYDVYRNGVYCGGSIVPGFTDNNAQPYTAYTYTVRAYDAAMNMSEYSGPVEVYIGDIILPAPPSMLSASFVGDTSVRLSWTMPDGDADAAGYRIYRDGMEAGISEVQEYTDTGLSPGTQYVYTVSAYDDGGNTSEQSEPLTVTTLPAVPEGIVAEAASTSVSLSWGAVHGAEGYDIEADGVITGIGADTEYLHSGLMPNTQHTYRIKAKSRDGEGEWSEIVSQYTMAAVPESIKAVAVNEDIIITWEAADGAEGYDIEVDGNIFDNGLSLTYTHSGLMPDSSHIYRVRAKNSRGEGDWSGEISKTALNNTVLFYGTMDNSFYFALTCRNVQSFEDKVFKVLYNPDEVEAEDLCSLTPQADLSPGPVHEAGITITGFEPGEVSFTVDREALEDRAYYGVVSRIRFRPKIDGATKITYKVEKIPEEESDAQNFGSQ